MTPPETRIRERLLDLAGDAPSGSSVPPTLGPRARRRIVAVTTGRTIVAVVLIAAVAVGVRDLARSAPPRPANPQRTDLFKDARGKLLFHVTGWFQSPSQYVAIDPSVPIDPRVPGAWTVIPITGGEPIAWSADGDHMLLRAGRWMDLWVLNADGSRVRLTRHTGTAWGSFSPDGASVVYADQSGLHVVGIDGSGERLLVPREPHVFRFAPAWSPDGSTIVYLQQGRSNSYQQVLHSWSIQRVSPDGSGNTTVVDLHALAIAEPDALHWSPDGSQLAFSYTRVNKGPGRLVIVRADGAGYRQIRGTGDSWSPAWSADGAQLAVSQPTGLALVDVRTGTVNRVGHLQVGYILLWNHATH